MLRRLRVTIEGRSYDVTVEDLTSTDNALYPAPSSMPAAASPAEAPPPAPMPAAVVAGDPSAGSPGDSGDVGDGAVISTMSGVLNDLLVDVGQQVSAGDTVAHIEAMKMKTPLVTNLSGTVASIEFAVGEQVLAGQTVLTLR
ncbi:biotin carboxyl carrier protein [Kineosphaera limosa]|uniref:Putative acyl-CoA carboxylase n=1 Tax=Kineosphaera limosa NBRC 100340 TaxID=1184609 RepID=K6WD54_9MICO|nr:acetyl-CoA carboxylase biotin carboxyl carrier protein subunit [Kineosphaera limosa]NYE02594.1 biotin carboxyl carrier protein [Kineosphaera limosa]GAB97210.1 putative acyl-CoA carboxylase [Kineosphaera limosa NBRC 100340]